MDHRSLELMEDLVLEPRGAGGGGGSSFAKLVMSLYILILFCIFKYVFILQKAHLKYQKKFEFLK